MELGVCFVVYNLTRTYLEVNPSYDCIGRQIQSGTTLNPKQYNYCKYIVYTERKRNVHVYSLYQGYIVCVNEFVFEMLNVQIYTDCDTFHCN